MLDIYCVTHKPLAIPKIAGLHTYQVGNDEFCYGDFRDNTGKSIAEKNSTWSENTALYNVWQNHQSIAVGFCHYRRFLLPGSLNSRMQADLDRAKIEYPTTHMKNYSSGAILPEPTLFKHLAQSEQSYQQGFIDLLNGVDIVLPKPNSLPQGGFLAQYAQSHPVWPFYELLTIMTRWAPNQARDIQKYFDSYKKAYWSNLFVMQWELFDNYCEFMFPLLFELEKRIALPDKPYQKRVFAFLSERLLNYWIYKESLTKAEIDWCMTEAVDKSSEAHQCIVAANAK